VPGAAFGHDGSLVISTADDGACLVFAAEWNKLSYLFTNLVVESIAF